MSFVFPVGTRPAPIPKGDSGPITPDPAAQGVTWYLLEDGSYIPGEGTYVDIVAQNIESVIICANNIDAIIAAPAAASSAAASAASATASATSATNSAAAAANSASLAGASATAAQTSATNAKQSETNAAASASAANNSAQGAATSATQAANSATAAAGSATAANNSWVTFNSMWYGPYPSTPATDPYSGAPTPGDVYFDTGTNQVMVRGNSAWQPISTGVTSVNGKTGAVTLLHTDISDWNASLAPYATLASPILTGDPQAPTPAPGDNDTSIATTAFVKTAVSGSVAGVSSFNTRTGAITLTTADVTGVLPASATAPLMNGTAAVGTAVAWSHGDHVHPTDTSLYAASNPAGYQTAAQVTASLAGYAPLASPVFTGAPSLPAGAVAVTAAPADNDTSIATTAFVKTAMGAVQAGAIIAPTPPAFVAGSIWYDSTGGQTYIAYDDGNSQQFVTASNFTGLANAATKTDVGSALNNVGRNLIHNGLFTVAQRGNGAFTTTGAGVYTADRWRLGNAAGLDTASIQRGTLTDADRTAIGDEAATYTLNNTFTGNAAAGSNNYIDHPLEGTRRLAGKTVIVSFWAVAGTALKLGINMYQLFGTGGSPSTFVTVLATGIQVALTTVWTRYSATITLPSVAGKTLGTNGDDSTLLRFSYSAGATANAQAGNIGVQSGSVNLWGVQLEIAQPGQTAPSPLEKRDPVLELQQCQRFYQTGQIYTQTVTTSLGQVFAASSLCPVAMRSSPAAITITTNASSNVAVPSVSHNGNMFMVTSSSTIASGSVAMNVVFTASADL